MNRTLDFTPILQQAVEFQRTKTPNSCAQYEIRSMKPMNLCNSTGETQIILGQSF